MANVVKVILFILVILGPGLSSWAEIYVWEDENGVKHFSNDGGDAHVKDVSVQEEIKWSREDEEKWKGERKKARVKHNQRMADRNKEEKYKAMKKKKCLEAKAAYEKVKKQYSEFVPKPLPHYGGLPKDQIPAAIRYKRKVRRQNEENKKIWESEKKRAIESAEKNIDRCCKD